jgi:hypothetical protein
MSKKRIILSLLILALLAVSMVNMVETVSAQSIPKPAIPEFSVKLEYATYNDTKNPYKGNDGPQIVTTTSIQVTIKNQPYSYSNKGITYKVYPDIRMKLHSGNWTGNWIEIYSLKTEIRVYDEKGNHTYAQYISASPQSNSSNTIKSFLVMPYHWGPSGTYCVENVGLGTYSPALKGWEGEWFLEGSQIDFQVMALVGHDAPVYYLENTSPLGYYPEWVQKEAPAFDIESGWSNTQSLTISKVNADVQVISKPTEHPQGIAKPAESSNPNYLLLIVILIIVSSIAIVSFRRISNRSLKLCRVVG